MNTGMKLAYFTTDYPSVSHTFIRRELREIERRGHSVMRLALRPSRAQLCDPLDIEESEKTVYCLGQSLIFYIFPFTSMIFGHPVRFIKALILTVKMGWKSEKGIIKHLAYLLEAMVMRSICKKNRIDHVHVHFGTNVTTVARLLKHCGGPTYSFTVHGPAEFDAPESFGLSGKINDSQFVIAITDYCSAQLRRWSSIDNWNKIKIVHCSVGDDFFNSLEPIGEDSKTLVCVGRLSAQKGQITLIDAFSKIVAVDKDARLVLVGDGEMRCVIEQRIKEAGIESHVQITGFVSEDEVRKQISHSRALVMPSFAEGLPMVIMEAFAVGRPVISTYIAGIPELVVDGQNGWLIPAANEDLLYDAMLDSLKKPVSELEAMAEKGRQLTKRNHYTPLEGEKLEKLFFSRDHLNS